MPPLPSARVQQIGGAHLIAVVGADAAAALEPSEPAADVALPGIVELVTAIVDEAVLEGRGGDVVFGVVGPGPGFVD